MKILLVEDEMALAKFIEKGLQQAGYMVRHIANGSAALKLATEEDFDLILLDLMLPGLTGFDILTNLRSFNIKTTVFIMSAMGASSQIVKGLDLGAVDYIKKPFDWDELLARIRVIQKKTNNTGSSILQISDLKIDQIGRKVFRADKEVRLTNKEFALLEYLAINANKIVSKNRIMLAVWDMDFDPGSNLVEVHMYQLRKKVDRDFSEPMIETIIGSGYSLKGIKY